MDLFSLVARLKLDSSEYEEGLKQSEKGASSFGNAFKKAGVVAVAAIGAATVAVGGLTKKAVESYAEYEQLAGGVKKLYGDASDELMRYAEQGYKTSGMSANRYMELATSFSAALINSLDGDTSKAAKQTDVAMRAISDNFNTFGGDIQSIQYAFQGFAKQNYTMLDNLKLGYGGTKTEMERLIDDANRYAKANGMAADLSINSFSDIVTAIDLIQQKQHIAGTTAKEAATTIEGSLNMTKAAWENLVAGFANPDADIGKLMDNLVVAIVGDKKGEGLLNQVIPAVERALDGIGQLIERAAPILSKHFPKLISTMLPRLLKAATTLVSGIVKALPTLLQVLVKQIPVIVQSLVTALTQALPLIAEVAPKLILTLAKGISGSLPTLIPAMVDAILTMVDGLLDNIDKLVEAAIVLMTGLAEGLIKAIPVIIEKVPKIISSLVNALFGGAGPMISTGAKLIGDFASGLWKSFSSIPGNVANRAKQITASIKSGIGNLTALGWNKIVDLWNGLKERIAKIPSDIWDWASNIKESIKNGVGNLYRVGWDLIAGLWKGIKKRFEYLIENVKDIAENLAEAVKNVLGISSPSKVFAEIGKWIPEGLALGIDKNMNVLYDASDAMAEATTFEPTSFDAENLMSEHVVGGSTNNVTQPMSVEINVYATPQQNERKIAEMVQRQLVLWDRQKRMAYI